MKKNGMAKMNQSFLQNKVDAFSSEMQSQKFVEVKEWHGSFSEQSSSSWFFCSAFSKEKWPTITQAFLFSKPIFN